MAPAHRDPPRRFFQQSEFRRLVSMIFLLVILLAIIESSRGPGTARLLVGRTGNQDQIVGKVIDEAADRPDHIPASPRPASSAPLANSHAPLQSLAMAEGSGNVNSTAASTATERPTGVTAAANRAAPAVVGLDNSAPTTAVTPNAKPLPPATGVTDEDPDEAAAAEEDLQYINDESPGIVKPEMNAYERIVRWVTSQSYQRMEARSPLKKLNFAQVVGGAGEIRGKLFQFDLHVRRATAYDEKLHFYNDDEDPHDPVQLYEMWGVTDESRGRLIQLVIVDPPAGMPIGANIQEDVRFVGYFFKLQGYEPAKALPGARPEIAPTFIGRVLWMKRPPVIWLNQADIGWIAAVAGGALFILIAWLAWLLLRKTRPNVAQLAIDLSFPSSVSIDDWLNSPDQTGSPREHSSRHRDESVSELDLGPIDDGRAAFDPERGANR